MIEDKWAHFKVKMTYNVVIFEKNTQRWLPQSGPYNLEKMLDLYLWFHELKLAGKIYNSWAIFQIR